MKILEDFEFSKTRGGRKPRHNWKEMVDGQVRVAVRGEDYRGKDESFMNSLYSFARKNELRVACQKVEEGVAFCFTSRSE